MRSAKKMISFFVVLIPQWLNFWCRLQLFIIYMNYWLFVRLEAFVGMIYVQQLS